MNHAELVGFPLRLPAVAGHQGVGNQVAQDRAVAVAEQNRKQNTDGQAALDLNHGVFLDDMAHFVADDSGQLVIRWHIVDQALEQVDVSAGNRQCIHFLGVQHLESIGQILAVGYGDNARAKPGDPRLQLRIIDQSIFFLQIGGNTLADFDFLFGPDQQRLRCRRGNDIGKEQNSQQQEQHPDGLLPIQQDAHLHFTLPSYHLYEEFENFCRSKSDEQSTAREGF